MVEHLYGKLLYAVWTLMCTPQIRRNVEAILKMGGVEKVAIPKFTLAFTCISLQTV